MLFPSRCAVRGADGVVASHVFDDRHVGAPGIAHGGAVATVLDDLLGFLLYLTGQPAVTRSLTIEYLSPVLLGVQYELAGKAMETKGRKRFVEAEVADPQQRIVARATALFVAVEVAHFDQAHSAEEGRAHSFKAGSRAGLQPLGDGTMLLQARYKRPGHLDVCAGQHGSVSHYYDL